ncbi:unnamed protein product, partial [Mesorhabditis belari]|uniref:Major facilitator superfamily (MFS) profile domain-containing protein n=1 Tax=Mesorhabditis belari TaxID=2138241 RepID=A0AAF3ELR8_9BILA
MLGVTVQGMMKTDLNMAMVCMLNHTESVESTNDSNRDTCPARNSSTNEQDSEKINGKLHWSSQAQAWIFASFYWGGLVSVLLCSNLVQKFGAARVLLIGTILNVVGSWVTPVAAQHGGVAFLIVVRFVMGLGQGVLLPTAATVIAAWFPAFEKSTASAIYTAGNQISTILSLFVSSQLCQIDFLGGWPSIFYLYGAFGAIFCVLWLIVINDSPAESRFISEEEKSYILEGRKGVEKRVKAPWRRILTSSVIWAMVLCTAAQSIITVSLTTYLPRYLKFVLRMNLTSNGIWSALPFICQLFSKFVMAAIADAVKRRYKGSLNIVTKFFNSIASFGAAACVIGVTFVSCDEQAIAVMLFAGAMAILSGYIPGYFTSLLSVAPAHTAAVNSLTRVFGQIASIASPYIIGFITVQNTMSEWRIVFFVIAGALIVSGTFFLIFGSAEPLPWAVRAPASSISTDSVSTWTTQSNEKKEIC